MLFWCDKFLAFAPETLSEWDGQLVKKFRTKIETERYATETVRTGLLVVKRVYEIAQKEHEAQKDAYEEERNRLVREVSPQDPNAVAEVIKALAIKGPGRGPRWDLGKRYLPRAQASEISKPAMKFEEIEKIVATARSGKLDKPETAFIALSSVYGYRAGEIRAVQREDLDYRHGTIFVNTEKGGERREQLLAPEIIPYLKKYDWEYDFTADQMNRMFAAICAMSGVKNEYRKRWHAVRRYVETVVPAALKYDRTVADDPDILTDIFFRYRMVTSRRMPDRYNSTVALEADKLALAHNPVVALWV
jgi:integrase